MELEQMINKVEERLGSSPIRKYFNQKNPVLFNEFKDNVEKVNDVINTLYENLSEPIKVVLMGEVKSGKSTLLNSIAGDTVSPMDVVEATAAIIEVYYSLDEEGIIEKKNGEKIYGTLEEIRTILKDYHRDLEFFNECEIVKIGMPLKNLKKIRIVDTPGIGTITEQNSKKAEDFIQKADVILWVFNGNQLGQEDIEEEVKKITKMGKKIVGVINKIDEVDGSPDRLISYMEQNLWEYIDDFYAVSSYMALTAIKENDKNKYEESGIAEIIDYIEENIEKEPDKVQLNSIYSSLQSLIVNDLDIHKTINDTTGFMIENISKYEEKINYYNQKIKSEISNDLNNWYKNVFFADEEKELLSLVGKAEALTSKCNEYFNNSYIEKSFDKQLVILKDEMQAEWDKKLSSENKKLYDRVKGIYNNSDYCNDRENENSFRFEERDINPEFSNTINGIKNGAVAGMALSGYFAWLGPGAAHLSIGSAIGAVMPPALIVGAAIGSIGLINNVIKVNSQKNELKKELISVINEIRKTSYENVKKMKEYLCNISDSVCNNSIKQFDLNAEDSLNKEEMYKLQHELNEYTKMLEISKEEMKNNKPSESQEQTRIENDLEDLLD